MFQSGVTALSYAVLRQVPDPFDSSRSEIHLRQVFIARAHRSRGVGRQALELLRIRFPDARWWLEVLETNPRARKFCQSQGFTSYATILEYQNQKESL